MQGVVGFPVRRHSAVACTSVVAFVPYASRSRGRGYERGTYPTNARRSHRRRSLPQVGEAPAQAPSVGSAHVRRPCLLQRARPQGADPRLERHRLDHRGADAARPDCVPQAGRRLHGRAGPGPLAGDVCRTRTHLPDLSSPPHPGPQRTPPVVVDPYRCPGVHPHLAAGGGLCGCDCYRHA